MVFIPHVPWPTVFLLVAQQKPPRTPRTRRAHSSPSVLLPSSRHQKGAVAVSVRRRRAGVSLPLQRPLHIVFSRTGSTPGLPAECVCAGIGWLVIRTAFERYASRGFIYLAS